MSHLVTPRSFGFGTALTEISTLTSVNFGINPRLRLTCGYLLPTPFTYRNSYLLILIYLVLVELFSCSYISMSCDIVCAC